jgi:hypothetical protein
VGVRALLLSCGIWWLSTGDAVATGGELGISRVLALIAASGERGELSASRWQRRVPSCAARSGRSLSRAVATASGKRASTQTSSVSLAGSASATSCAR